MCLEKYCTQNICSLSDVAHMHFKPGIDISRHLLCWDERKRYVKHNTCMHLDLVLVYIDNIYKNIRRTRSQHLTHWGRVTHIWVSKQTTIGSDNGLSPGRRQAIIRTNAGILFIWTVGTNSSEILSEIHTFAFKKMHLQMSSAKWWQFCFGPNVLNDYRLAFQFSLRNILKPSAKWRMKMLG